MRGAGVKPRQSAARTCRFHLSYAVARRAREIAIRVAFGADSSRVTALVVRDMLGLVVTGIVLALPVCWWLDRFVRSQLYEVTPTDPAAIVSPATAVLLASAAAAVWMPSRRALRVTPIRRCGRNDAAVSFSRPAGGGARPTLP